MDERDRGDLQRRLDRGLEALGQALDAMQRARLLDYLGELARWNRAYNLTAVREPAEMVTRHLLDSLAVRPWLHGHRVLDIGTGAGLPGIPLAIAEPDRRFTLLDAGGKKVRFVRHALLVLGLENADAVHARVEDYPGPGSFDTLLSRAFSDLDQMLVRAGRLSAPDGRILAMKGVYPAGELASITSDYELAGVHRLAVPGLEAERHLVEIRPVSGRRSGSDDP